MKPKRVIIMTKPPSNLFTSQVIIGFNTIGYILRKEKKRLKDLEAGSRFAKEQQPVRGSELSEEFGIGLSHIQHALRGLVQGGILTTSKGPGGGFLLNVETLPKFTIIEAVMMLGQNLPPLSGGSRLCDFLTEAVYDILDVPLDAFCDAYFENHP